MVSVNHWKCMKVRGDYVVSTSKADNFLRLISTLSFDIWPQNQWVQSNFQSFSFIRLQTIANSRNFDALKTGQHGCEFLFAMLWSLLHLIFEGKVQNRLEATRSIWTPLCSEPVRLPFSSILPTRLDKPHSRFSILDPRFSIPDSRFSIPHSPFSILDPRSSILASRFSILDSRSSILDPRSSILDSRLSILNSRVSIFLDSLFSIIFEPRFTVLDRHGGTSVSYTCKILWDFVRILENTALLPVMYGCTDVQVPPGPFIHFIPMLWGLLACVALLPTTRYYWNHLEPSGNYETT